MTEQRQKLLDRFDSWFASNPNKRIISSQCANIAEDYAREQLRLHGITDLICSHFDPDNSTSSATKCKCGREKWEHPKSSE